MRFIFRLIDRDAERLDRLDQPWRVVMPLFIGIANMCAVYLTGRYRLRLFFAFMNTYQLVDQFFWAYAWRRLDGDGFSKCVLMPASPLAAALIVAAADVPLLKYAARCYIPAFMYLPSWGNGGVMFDFSSPVTFGKCAVVLALYLGIASFGYATAALRRDGKAA